MANQVSIRGGTLASAQIDYILLDGSSSMSVIWDDSLRSAQAYIDGVAAAGIHTAVTFHMFSSGDLDNVPYYETPIRDLPSLIDYPPQQPHGMTPLYDAIALVGRRLRDLNPERASIVIITDGGEMGSTHTDIHQAKAIIEWMKAKGWQVTFLGADFNNSLLARELGLSDANAIGASVKALPDIAKALAAKRIRYSASGDDIEFSEDERQQFGGFLPPPGE